MNDAHIINHIEYINQLMGQLENTETLDDYTKISDKIRVEREHLSKEVQKLYSVIHLTIIDKKKSFHNEIETKKNEIIQKVNELIAKYHNPSLIDSHASPSENTIYKMYSDFEVTSEKGGWGYGSHNLFRYLTPLFNRNVYGIIDFPCIVKPNFSYAIMTLDHCLEIYNLMRMYIRIIS
jgi:hypothetical protein